MTAMLAEFVSHWYAYLLLGLMLWGACSSMPDV